MLSRCFLDFFVRVGAFVIGLSQIFSFFSFSFRKICSQDDTVALQATAIPGQPSEAGTRLACEFLPNYASEICTRNKAVTSTAIYYSKNYPITFPPDALPLL